MTPLRNASAQACLPPSASISLRPAALATLLLPLFSACTNTPLREYVPQIITPYRIDIQQGNFVTLDMVEKLQAGQTKDQVRFILGTPMLTDVFHQERWDFVFRSAKGWNDPERRRLTVFFGKDERLAKWEAVDVPKAVDVAAPAPQEPPGLFRRLLGASSAAEPQAAASVASASAPVPAATATAAGAPDTNTSANRASSVAGVGNVATAAPDAAPAPVAAVSPAPPGAEKPGFLSRLFGRTSGAGAATAAAVPAAPPVVSSSLPAASVTFPAPAPVPAPAPAPVPVPAAAPAPAPAAVPVAASTPTAVAQAVSGPAAPPLPAAPAVKPAPVVAAAPPAATPASLTETPAPVRAAIIAAVEQWRQAWSSKNIAAYLASYDPKYTLIGLTRAEWQTQRAERIRRSAAINVTVSDVIMAQESDGAVAVSFIQKYESATFKESGRKLLVFGNDNGKWLIREESFLANSK